MTCFHTDLRDTEELLRRLAWRTEAIDHLIDEIGECFLIFDRRKASIDLHLLFLICDISAVKIRILTELDRGIRQLLRYRPVLTDGAQSLHRFFKHGAVCRKADAGDITMLLSPEKISGTADLQIPHGDFEAASELGEFTDRIQSFFCHLGKHLPPPVEEPRPCDLF